MTPDHDRPASQRLGIIFPDDGQRGPDYELLRLDPWLARQGLAAVEVRIAFSAARRCHAHENLFVTGSLENLLPAARQLEEAGCHAVVWACTSGSFIGGLQWARLQVQALSEATGLPASSTTLAIIEALRALDASHVDILGAYPEPVTRALASCLGEAGLEVKILRWLDCPEGSVSHRLDIREEVRRFAGDHPERSRPLVIPDTAIDTLEHLAGLEAIARRLVVTANGATLWHGLRLLGLSPAKADQVLRPAFLRTASA